MISSYNIKDYAKILSKGEYTKKIVHIHQSCFPFRIIEADYLFGRISLIYRFLILNMT